jgi:hypothetical protein
MANLLENPEIAELIKPFIKPVLDLYTMRYHIPSKKYDLYYNTAAECLALRLYCNPASEDEHFMNQCVNDMYKVFHIS